MNYKLADRVRVVVLDEKRIYLIDDGIMELEGCSLAQARAIQLLSKGCSSQQIEAILSVAERDELFGFLKSEKLLRNDFSNAYEGELVEKQIYYLDDYSQDPNTLQKNLEDSTVAVLGIGGIGSVVLQHLVGAGIRKFVLLDSDTVQRNNLNRQFLFGESDIDRLKVDVAKEQLLRINPKCEIRIHQVFVESIDSLSALDDVSIDLLINAADQPIDLTKILNAYCTSRRVPWMGAEIGRHSGSWGPLVVPDQTVCMNCFERAEKEQMEELERTLRNSMTSTLQASFGPTNTIISAFLAKDAILYLAAKDKPASFGARCTFDFKTFEMTSTSFRNGQCDCWKGEMTCQEQE